LGRTLKEDLRIGIDERRRSKEREGKQAFHVNKGTQEDTAVQRCVEYIQTRILILA
jgi:hypothetical protein